MGHCIQSLSQVHNDTIDKIMKYSATMISIMWQSLPSSDELYAAGTVPFVTGTLTSTCIKTENITKGMVIHKVSLPLRRQSVNVMYINMDLVIFSVFIHVLVSIFTVCHLVGSWLTKDPTGSALEINRLKTKQRNTNCPHLENSPSVLVKQYNRFAPIKTVGPRQNVYCSI